jgi:hypothetical protein
MGAPTNFVGNDFILPQAKPRKVRPVINAGPMPIHIPVMATQSTAIIDVAISHNPSSRPNFFKPIIDLFHRYTLGVFAILFLIVGSSGIQVASSYLSASADEALNKSASFSLNTATISGLNKKVPTAQLEQEVQK